MAISRRRLLAGLASAPIVGCAASRTPAVTHVVAPELRVRVPAPWKQDLGELEDVAPGLRVAFSDAHGFAALPPPGPRGWRALQVEAPQTVAGFRASAPNLRTAPRDRIAVLPLGGFPLEVVVDGTQVALVRTPELSAIAGLLAAFFATPVDLLPTERLPVRLLRRRVVAGRSQFDARALLNVASIRLPADAHSMLVLVNVDLYVLREQQYAFGWSTLHDRLGVVGFSRLDPGALLGQDDADGGRFPGVQVAPILRPHRGLILPPRVNPGERQLESLGQRRFARSARPEQHQSFTLFHDQIRGQQSHAPAGVGLGQVPRFKQGHFGSVQCSVFSVQ